MIEKQMYDESDSVDASKRVIGSDVEKQESSKGSWDTRIIIQRHGKYKPGFPEDGWLNPTDEEKETLGHLTPEGIKEAKDVAFERVVRAIKEAGSSVDFVVVASPSQWLDHPELGRRAVETGEIISDEIKSQLRAAGLSEEQLLNITPSIDGDRVRLSDKVEETQLFQNMDFTNEMRQKYGGQNRDFWDAYNADADREQRKELGVEGAPEAADRANLLMNILARWARVRHIEEPHRKTVIFVVSHHEILEPYAQRVLGAHHDEFAPQYNDGIEIDIDSEGIGHTTLGSRAVDVMFSDHGKPTSIDRDE